MKLFLLIPVLFPLAVLATEAPPNPSGPNPMQFTGSVVTVVFDDSQGEIGPPGKVEYTALVLDESLTVQTDLGYMVTTDRVQFGLDNGEVLMDGVRVKLDCGFVMGAETGHHHEPLICGKSKVTELR
ncbi:hypothetical protein [uncultured Halopseudomonas sp.]|uniref:hypothetical protein n=1 Tax=uncultured Halopseudomonas sp. TaxID=2901193 RepID=UPI0030EC42F3|tara:strand:+ start:58675 stop:59055 length:381 start_codon:yes stop_codon:yes gene_type:complete